jgi:hypothetical protein
MWWQAKNILVSTKNHKISYKNEDKIKKEYDTVEVQTY